MIQLSLRRVGLAIFLSVAGSFVSRPLGAQSVSPPIAEYKERARSSFTLTNGTLFPLSVVLEVRGFEVSENGDLTDVPLDTTRVHVRLSATSFRIPPRGTYTVFYEASADSTPAWFSILSALSGARSQNGLNLRILLPHVVYLNQREPLARGAVVVHGVHADSSGAHAVVELENTSDRLGRVLDLSVRDSTGHAVAGGAFPLFPHARRRITVPWDGAAPPVRAVAKFDGFTADSLFPPGGAGAR
jgi:hypothetical protein